MKKVLGVNEVLNKQYRTLEIGEEWVRAVGVLPDPFTMLVVGRPKNGKTSFVMRLCRHLAERYKVFYLSMEEGDSKTIQNALKLADMGAVAGSFQLGDGFTFDELCAHLKRRNSAKVVVIDSLDYMYLTLEQYKFLTREFPRKSFIVICWGDSSGAEFAKPESYFGKKIKYQVGTVALVKDFVVETRGRYGPTDALDLWPGRRKANAQRTLFDA